MATSRCTTCGLNRSDCRCSPPSVRVEITPYLCCSYYLLSTLITFILSLALACFIILVIDRDCYLELFANSISVSNATNVNASTADWRVGFITRSPVSGCKFSLSTMQSRLLRGGEVITETSPLLDCFGQLVNSAETDGPRTTVGSKNVTTPGVIGGVVWDFRVELVARVNASSGHGLNRTRGRGLLMVFCNGLPVKFTADSAGDVSGSLLGYMRRCEYVFRQDSLSRRYA